MMEPPWSFVSRRKQATLIASSSGSTARLDKRDLMHRIRALEQELESERQRRGALAYDQQALLARLLRLETEIVLLQTEQSHSK